MFAVDDIDRQRAGETDQFASARIRHDRDDEFWYATRHRSAVLQREAALAPVQCTGDAFHRDIAGRTFDIATYSQHLPMAAGLQIAMELLVERHPADAGVAYALG